MKIVSSAITYLEGSEKTILSVHKENHGLRTGDMVTITRSDGNSIFFTQEVQVVVFDADNFTFEKGSDLSYAFEPPAEEGTFSANSPFYFSKTFERDEYLTKGEESNYFDTQQTYKTSYTDKVYQTFLIFQTNTPHILVSNLYGQETDEFIDELKNFRLDLE